MVLKRNGSVEKFSEAKLEASVKRALKHARERRVSAHEVAKQVCRQFAKTRSQLVSFESIRRAVVKTLVQSRLQAAVAAYDNAFLQLGKLKTKRVIKRSGEIAEFDAYRIFKSIRKALHQSGAENHALCARLSRQIAKAIDRKFKGKNVPTHAIRRVVEQTLERLDLREAARLYVLHKYF